MIYFKKVITIVLLMMILVANTGNVFATELSDTKAKTLYTYPNVENMSRVGTNRGNYHDRQHLDIYMEAGASFEIRQANPNVTYDLTLDCFNNDSHTEKTYTIPKTGEWITISVDVASVPFIRTVFDVTEEPQIEMRNFKGTHELTYYYYEDNEEAFFQKWKDNNHEYAVIENDRATFLVPVKDRDLLVQENPNAYTFGSIDELLEYYHDFVEQFDRFAGLSYDTENELNKNVKTKFFVKANKHGAGAAYYGGNHTAQNGDSISAYLSRGWLSLHEFGHGYEGSLANQELYLVDVMTNILSHYFQITFLPENDSGWLGKKADVEDRMKRVRDEKENFNDYEYKERLYFFVNMLDKVGPEETMSYIYSEYRKIRSENKSITTSDMYATGVAEVSGYNLVPYFHANKVYPTVEAMEEIFEAELPMLYFLRDLTETDEKAIAIKTDLGLDGRYDLVSNSEIDKYNMLGNAKINISIDDFNQIKGKKIYIKDGKNIVKEITIDKPNLEISDLKVGCYTLQIPNPKVNEYEYNYEYIIIKENTTVEKNVEYKKITNSPLASDTKILFLGLGNAHFATATIDLEEKTARIVSNNTEPHVYFDTEYASIEILDPQGNSVYSKSYHGRQKSPGDDIVNIDLGYQIKIRHEEPGRLDFESITLKEFEEFENTSKEVTTYTITKYGLQKEGISDTELYEMYKRKLDKYINVIETSYISTENQKNKYLSFNHRNKVLSSVIVLNDEDKQQYLENYKVLINGSAPSFEETKNLEFSVGDEVSILDKFSVTDIEDGKIILNSDNTNIITDAPIENNKFTKAGTYKTKIEVKDLDDNVATITISITVNALPEEDTTPDNTDKPEDNIPEEDATPDSTDKPEDNTPEEDTTPDSTDKPNDTKPDETSKEENKNQEEVGNQTGSENNTNTGNNQNNTTDTKKEETKLNDNTIASTTIPKAGSTTWIIGVLALLGVGIIVIKKIAQK